MKLLGLFLLLIGLGLGYYTLNMDTTVKVYYKGYNIFGLTEEVNNLGLMSDKQNYLIVSCFLVIGGIILLAIGDKDDSIGNKSKKYIHEFDDWESNKETTSAPTYCSNCGQAYYSKGKFCENCGKEL